MANQSFVSIHMSRIIQDKIFRRVIVRKTTLIHSGLILLSPVLLAGSAISAPAGFIDASTYGGGYNTTDATAALQVAINTGQNVWVPNMGTPWTITPITLNNSNQTIQFENGTVVTAKEGSFLGTSDSLFTSTNTTNVSVLGYGATFQMRKSDYTQNPYPVGEWRHGLRLNNVNGFQVKGLTIKETGGDGIYIGAADTGYSQDVLIKDVVLDNNYRQGISVISAKDLMIDNAIIMNTNGTAPESGIDFEPNFSDDILQNITVKNSIFSSNDNNGIQFATGMLADPSQVDITITNVTTIGNEFSGLRIYYYPLPGVTIKNSLFVGNQHFGVAVEGDESSVKNSVDYSAFWNNVNDIGGQAIAGAGTLTGAQPLFYSTDPSSPWFMYLDPSVSDLISLGADNGAYMGARPVYGTVVPEPAMIALVGCGALVSMLRHPRKCN
jgi:hypothetical protein